MNISYLKRLIRRYNIHSKKLGQHFLIDDDVAEKEIRCADIQHKDIVLEIGPGFGILTEKLISRAKKVIAIEKDRRLAEYLKTVLQSSNLEVINADALDYDFPVVDKIVANLPFQISSQITFKILKSQYQLAILTYQKEFAERLVSKKGSRLAINCYYYADARMLFEVSKNAYYPKPKVDTAVVALRPLPKKAFKAVDEKLFFELTEFLFTMRRKKIQTSIRDWLLTKGFEKKYVHKILASLPFANNRIENLWPEEINTIAEYIKSLI